MGVKPVNTPASSSEPPEEISDTERAIYGTIALTELRAFLDEWAQDRLCSRIADVRFRAGRIDAVWGVDLTDGRAVVIKTHRAPVDLDATRAALDAQHRLTAAGFPCPLPLAGPDQREGRSLRANDEQLPRRPPGSSPSTPAGRLH